MFERTFSFWRRLVGTHQAEAGDTAVEDERRLWVRYATEMQGNVLLPPKLGSERILADVCDLSVGGANLKLPKKLEPGQILTLELPAQNQETHTILACVVRSHPADDGGWSIGCVFSRELGGTDLAAFGAERKQTEGNDQRIWVRYACEVRAHARGFGADEQEARPITVLDISANGIGLIVSEAPESGSLLNIDLYDKQDRKICAILACVVQTAQRPGGDYAVGCNFIRELSEDELDSLL